MALLKPRSTKKTDTSNNTTRPSSTTESGGLPRNSSGAVNIMQPVQRQNQTTAAPSTNNSNILSSGLQKLAAYRAGGSNTGATPSPVLSLSSERANQANQQTSNNFKQMAQLLATAKERADLLRNELKVNQDQATQHGVATQQATNNQSIITPDDNIDLRAVEAQGQRDIDKDYNRSIDLIADLSERADDMLADNLRTIGKAFNIRKQQQEEVNQRQLSIMKTQGVRSGMARYSPQLNQSFLSEEESNGIMRLSELDVQEQSLIQTAQEANYNRNYQLLTTTLNQQQQIRAEKRQLVQDLSTLATQNQTRRHTELQEARTQETFQFEMAVTKSQTYAAALAETFSDVEDPEDKQIAITQLAEELGVDETILAGEVEKAIRARRLAELGVIQEQQAIDQGNQIELDGKIYQQNADGSYELVLGGAAPVLGAQTGTIQGLPAYNTRAANPNSKRSDRNMNPGNIKVSEFTKNYPGVIGVESSPAEDGGHFLIFDSPEAGLDAMGRLLMNPGYSNMTAQQAMKRYNGGNVPGAPKTYDAVDVGLLPGMDFQAQMGTPEKRRAVALAMAREEGWSGMSVASSSSMAQSVLNNVIDFDTAYDSTPDNEKQKFLNDLGAAGYQQPLSPEEKEAQDERESLVDNALKMREKAQEILDDPNLDFAVGPVQSRIPGFDILGRRSDIKKKIENVIAAFTVGELGKMSGTLTDKDIEILRNAGTTLDMRLTDEAFRLEVQNIIRASERVAKKYGVTQEQQEFFGSNGPINIPAMDAILNQ